MTVVRGMYPIKSVGTASDPITALPVIVGCTASDVKALALTRDPSSNTRGNQVIMVVVDESVAGGSDQP